MGIWCWCQRRMQKAGSDPEDAVRSYQLLPAAHAGFMPLLDGADSLHCLRVSAQALLDLLNHIASAAGPRCPLKEFNDLHFCGVPGTQYLTRRR